MTKSLYTLGWGLTLYGSPYDPLLSYLHLSSATWTRLPSCLVVLLATHYYRSCSLPASASATERLGWSVQQPIAKTTISLSWCSKHCGGRCWSAGFFRWTFERRSSHILLKLHRLWRSCWKLSHLYRKWERFSELAPSLCECKCHRPWSTNYGVCFHNQASSGG